jgi:acyl-CoA dehydrogenase
MDFQAKLDWMAKFVREEVEPLDLLFPSAGAMYDTKNHKARALIAPLREQVKTQRLWACHLPPELRGKGFGQLKLALMNEIIGGCSWAPTVFGCAAPIREMPKSWRCTAQPGRRSATCSRCSTATSCLAFR